LNQPLKSAHQTRLDWLAWASGSAYGSVRRRFLRGTTSPARFTISPMVLVAGHGRPGWSRSRIRFSLRGPQRMCASRSSSTARSISSPIWLGCERGARFNSIRPLIPYCR
jgi:hypothetical protein